MTKSASVNTIGVTEQTLTSPVMVAVPKPRIPAVVRFSFLIFVFSLPYDVIDLGFTAFGFSLPRLVGIALFGSFFLYYNPLSTKRSLPPVSKALWSFLGYAAVYFISGLFLSTEITIEFILSFATLAQLLLFFWIASHLLKDESLSRQVLLTYATACSMLALASMFSSTIIPVGQAAGRQTMLGQDLNALALLMGLAVLIVVGLDLNSTGERPLVRKILLLSMALFPFLAMVNTGSRSGLAAFVLGCLVLLIPYYRSRRTLAATLLAMVTIVGSLYMVISNPDFLERWQQSYQEGNLAGRENIIPTALEMISEKPILGWQPENSSYELGFRLGTWRTVAAHNLFLGLLLDVGIIGTIPFLIGLGLCVFAAWKARLSHLGVVPLALFVVALVGNMAIPALTWKPFWLVMALCFATAFRVEERPKAFKSLLRHPTRNTILTRIG